MTPSQRVLVNAIAQYGRTVIVMLLSLYMVRVVLSSLGQSDYGIYTVVAGCVAMLGFLTNSLVRTTQRFVSFYQGKNDIEGLKSIFNNCLIIHIFIGIIVVAILELLSPFIFDGFLNIPSDRLDAAIHIFHLVVATLFVTISAAPYRALLVSHENIVYISLIDIIDIVLKVGLVLVMSQSSSDRLVFYGTILLCFQFFNFLALSIYDYIKYRECVLPNFCALRLSYVVEMGKFAWWQIYGSACVIGRDQGLSIVLNRAFGTIMNAGLGIGTQVSGATNTLSSAIVNAMSPQIVKAEGAGDRGRTIWLSNVLSKMVFFLMSILGIPLLFEIPQVLHVWLDNYPESAVFFSRMYILALLMDSLTIGLTHVNNAIGNIGKYILVMNTPKFLTVIFSILTLKLGMPLIYIGVVYVTIEAICAFVRVPLIREQAGLNVRDFYHNVIIMEIIPAVICVATCWISVTAFDFSFRFLLTFAFSALCYSTAMYFMGFTNKEKNIIDNLLRNVSIKLLSVKIRKQ